MLAWYAWLPPPVLLALPLGAVLCQLCSLCCCRRCCLQFVFAFLFAWLAPPPPIFGCVYWYLCMSDGVRGLFFAGFRCLSTLVCFFLVFTDYIFLCFIYRVVLSYAVPIEATGILYLGVIGSWKHWKHYWKLEALLYISGSWYYTRLTALLFDRPRSYIFILLFFIFQFILIIYIYIYIYIFLSVCHPPFFRVWLS